jgi:hypothetical protein
MAFSDKFGAHWIEENEGDLVFEAYYSELDLLCTVFHRPSNFFRAIVFEKRTGGPQFTGLWWTRISDAVSLTLDDSMEYLRTVVQNHQCDKQKTSTLTDKDGGCSSRVVCSNTYADFRVRY